MKNNKMYFIFILAIILAIAGIKIIKIKEPSIDSYYEANLEPEEVIQKYYDGYNSHNKNKVRSTLMDGKNNNIVILFDKSKQIKICSINEDAKEKKDYIQYGRGLEENADNIKAYKVKYKEINLKDKSESNELWNIFCLEKDKEGNWLISDLGE